MTGQTSHARRHLGMLLGGSESTFRSTFSPHENSMLWTNFAMDRDSPLSIVEVENNTCQLETGHFTFHFCTCSETDSIQSLKK